MISTNEIYEKKKVSSMFSIIKQFDDTIIGIKSIAEISDLKTEIATSYIGSLNKDHMSDDEARTSMDLLDACENSFLNVNKLKNQKKEIDNNIDIMSLIKVIKNRNNEEKKMENQIKTLPDSMTTKKEDLVYGETEINPDKITPEDFFGKVE